MRPEAPNGLEEAGTPPHRIDRPRRRQGSHFLDRDREEEDVLPQPMLEKITGEGRLGTAAVSLSARSDGTAFGATVRSSPRPKTIDCLDPIAYVQAGSVAATDDAVWIANRFAQSVSRIDPKTNTIVATIELGRERRGIAVGDDSVWVTVA